MRETLVRIATDLGFSVRIMEETVHIGTRPNSVDWFPVRNLNDLMKIIV